MKKDELPASFRDPSGFVFTNKNRILRQINPIYKDNYELLMRSGLYQKLVKIGALIPHKEIDFSSTTAYKIIEPQPIPFISYPYEWSFSQLKDAALLTLLIQKTSLDFGMSLKDANSFNIQFLNGKPVLIDTLSFEKYEEGKPWVGYKQFCEHFLAPLALASYKDTRFLKLLQIYLDGIPLDLAAKILPFRARINFSLLLHLFLHARSQKQFAGVSLQSKTAKSFNRSALDGLIENLESGVKSLKWKPQKSVWMEYYRESESYKDKSFEEKRSLVGKYLEILRPKTLWDIGANTGEFTRIASGKGIFTVSLDNDPSVVEKNYHQVRKSNEKNILPLLADIANPSPSIGWENEERNSFLSRPLPDAVLALALIHHLAIGNNLPFSKLARFFGKICPALIIEFVPKDDRQTRRLLASRQDIFPDYNQENFEKEFGKLFLIKEKSNLSDSKRVMYLMVNRGKNETI